jgi:hypothetical protein
MQVRVTSFRVGKEEDYEGDNRSSFNVNSFFRNLGSETTGNFLFVTKQCKSTQGFITKFIEHIPIGSVCVADIQSHGRGRGYFPDIFDMGIR